MRKKERKKKERDASNYNIPNKKNGVKQKGLILNDSKHWMLQNQQLWQFINTTLIHIHADNKIKQSITTTKKKKGKNPSKFTILEKKSHLWTITASGSFQNPTFLGSPRSSQPKKLREHKETAPKRKPINYYANKGYTEAKQQRNNWLVCNKK